jgi:hypothetical protein
MGSNIRAFRTFGGVATMLRAYFGVGYGNFSMNDRVMTRLDRGPPSFGDTEYGFGGIYARGGMFFLKRPRGIKDLMGVEAFASLSANARGSSYAGVGARLQYTLAFAEVEMLMSGTGDDDKSYTLSVGLGFF